MIYFQGATYSPASPTGIAISQQYPLSDVGEPSPSDAICRDGRNAVIVEGFNAALEGCDLAHTATPPYSALNQK